MERNQFFTIVAISLVQHGHMPPPEPPGPPVFSMAGAERTTALLEGAGFSGVRTEEVSVRFELPDAEEYLSLISDTAWPLARVLRGLSEPDREAVKAVVEDSLARHGRARLRAPRRRPLRGRELSARGHLPGAGGQLLRGTTGYPLLLGARSSAG